MKNGHDVFVNYIRNAGAYLVENAEDIVGNSPRLNRIYINCCISWPDDDIPILSISKNYFVDGESTDLKKRKEIRLDYNQEFTDLPK